MPRTQTRRRGGRHSVLGPLRIRVRYQSKLGDRAIDQQARWVVEPVERDVRGDREWDEFASYHLEIRYNGMWIDAENPYGRIQWVAHKDGDRYVFLEDEAFEEEVQEIMMHPATPDEEAMTEDQAREHLANRNIWPVKAGHAFGFLMSYFPRMEAAWAGALQFMDFGYIMD